MNSNKINSEIVNEILNADLHSMFLSQKPVSGARIILDTVDGHQFLSKDIVSFVSLLLVHNLKTTTKASKNKIDTFMEEYLNMYLVSLLGVQAKRDDSEAFKLTTIAVIDIFSRLFKNKN